jgi:hypothetical protein
MGLAVITVRVWTSRETRLLREALRMTIEEFAERLSVAPRTVSYWEADGPTVKPRAEMQQALDTLLAQAQAAAQERFAHATFGSATVQGAAAGPLRVDSHKFVPVFIGEQRPEAGPSSKPATESAPRWRESCSHPVSWPGGSCMAHVFDFGVAVFHIIEQPPAAGVTDLAVWRYRSYARDLPAVESLTRSQFPYARPQASPQYVLSLYHLLDSGGSGVDADTALHLLCSPSVLVDRSHASGAAPLAPEVEADLFATAFRSPGLVPFGVPGVSAGYAAWSGVSYLATAAERALPISDLVDCELLVQALWCYCTHIQTAVEDGQDPHVPEQFGWRFLRAAESRLTTARPTETSAHRVMREAIITTSGLPERLRAARQALREAVS